jgi:hypothetical protein
MKYFGSSIPRMGAPHLSSDRVREIGRKAFGFYELGLVDAATRRVQAQVRGTLKTLTSILAEHRRFIKRMKRLRRTTNLRWVQYR